MAYKDADKKVKDKSNYQHQYYLDNRKKVLKQCAEYREKHREESREYQKKHYLKVKNTLEHKVINRRSVQKYRQTLKGKEVAAKNCNYRRELGFNKLIENDWNCKINWHHVNDNDVVPIPENLHILCYRKTREEHREICNKLINILYGGIVCQKQH